MVSGAHSKFSGNNIQLQFKSWNLCFLTLEPFSNIAFDWWVCCTASQSEAMLENCCQFTEYQVRNALSRWWNHFQFSTLHDKTTVIICGKYCCDSLQLWLKQTLWFINYNYDKSKTMFPWSWNWVWKLLSCQWKGPWDLYLVDYLVISRLKVMMIKKNFQTDFWLAGSTTSSQSEAPKLVANLF